MDKTILKDILKIILEVAELIKYKGFMFNERYLHHYFSHRAQERYKTLSFTGNNNALTLHPEWPTYKKQTQIAYGRYKKENGRYKPNPDGTAGFIDFAIGDYQKPEIGIEFSLKYGWANEEIVYDFLKLLDKENPFKISVSFNIIFREKRLVEGGYLKDLEYHMNNAYQEAVNRLDHNCDHLRKIYFIVTEIAQNNQRRSWYFDRTHNIFQKGLLALEN